MRITNDSIKEIHQCVVCYCNDEDVIYKCNQCKDTLLCGVCITKMQENGQAGKCPVCKKETPWCNNIPPFVDKTENHQGLPFQVLLYKIILCIMILCVCWFIGYIVAYSIQGEFRETETYPFAMKVILYIMLGLMTLFVLTIVLTACGMCSSMCISLGISRDNI